VSSVLTLRIHMSTSSRHLFLPLPLSPSLTPFLLGSKYLVENALSTDKELKLYQNCNHVLLEEPEGRAEMVRWWCIKVNEREKVKSYREEAKGEMEERERERGS